MTILIFSRFERLIAASLLPFLLLFIVPAPSRAQDKAAEEVRGSNVRWTKKSDVIIINYDLVGSQDAKHEVKLVMRKDKDDLFIFVPKNVDGHIGEGVVAGPDREIRWYYRAEFPLRIENEEYYFEIQVERMNEASRFMYYIAGAAAVAGGIIAIIVSKNQSAGPELDRNLPSPPVRP